MSSRRGFDRSVLPGRGLLLTALGAALAGGALFGLAIGIVAPWGAPTGSFVPVSQNSLQTASAAPAVPAARTTASARPSTASAKPIRTVTKQPDAPPENVIQHPESDATMFLATLDSFDPRDPNRIVLWLKPADLVSGDQARQYWQSQGQEPRDKAAVTPDDASAQEFVLPGDTALWGGDVLADQHDGSLRRLDLQEFLFRAGLALAQNQHPPVWIKRSLGITGSIIYLAEQDL
jgi:hypothetical protein